MGACDSKEGPTRTVEAEQVSKGSPVPGPVSGLCPLGHGTVYAAPYPGYVHGKNPAICAKGCVPMLDPYPGESVREKLLREAREYQYLLQIEKGRPEEALEKRMKEIEEEVAATGTYTQTFEEIEHGARVGWRNAPKCSNRKFWNELVCFDRRDATTNEAMWKATLEHLEVNVKCGVSKAFMTIFPAAHPETGKGPRIWNMQVLRYASYIDGNCKVIGDPANLAFTDMLKARFGWEPQEGVPNQILPTVVQAVGEEPQLFQAPEPYIPRVRIWHPNHPFLSDMNIEWYGIPAVAMLDLQIGGLTYTCPLFNGWYTSYEILRDLTDTTRLNLMPAVATKLGLDIQNDSTLWKDEVMAMLHEALLYSFAHAKVTMVDHHTLMKSFYAWYKSEMKHRGFCPGNWKWLIPPLVGSNFDAYLGLNKMTEYTLKPAYVMGPGWRRYEREAFPASDTEAKRKRAVKMALTIFAFGKLLRIVRKVRPSVLILYASSGGVTRQFAGRLVTIMKPDTQLEVMDVGRFDISQDERKLLHALEHCCLCCFLTPTYGNGQPPTEAEEFLQVLGSGRWDFTGVRFAVLGFGNSQYQKFCGGADVVHDLLEKAGGKKICPPGRCDEVLGREGPFDNWVRVVLHWIFSRSKNSAGQAALRTASKGSTVHLEHLKIEKSGEFVQGNYPVRLEFLNTKSLVQAHKDEVVDKSRTLVAAFEKSDEQEVANVRLRPRDLWFTAQVKEARMLHVDKASDGFGRATVLVRLDMSKLRVPYKSGDHVAIQPPNTALEPQLKKFLKALGRDADAIFEAKKPPGVDAVSKERYPLLHEVLGHKHTVGNVFLTMAAVGDVVSPQACDQLADFAKDPDRQRLREAAVDVEKHKELAKTKGLQWVNIFEDFPSLKSGKVPMELLLMLIPVIRPRLYSVASSPVQEPGELHLVVGRLVYKTGDGKKRLGVCSNFFSKLDAKDEGLAEVRFQVRPCTSFRLPPDLLSPIIMIATGTGLAPFRGFLQERLALAKAKTGKTLGTAALVVGCKNKAELLLKEELKKATDGGAVTFLLEAFSREPGQPKCYVQDRVRQDAGKLRPLLENPKCEVYLCGGSEMAGDVKKALEDVCSGCVEKLETSGRLHEDLFGIISVTS